MKIQLPNGQKIKLDDNLPINEKISLVEDIISKWDEVIICNWDSTSIRYFLDGLSNYLVWHKDEESKKKQDKDVISILKMKKMNGKKKNNTVPFSGLSSTNKELLGLDGEKDV